MLENYDKVLEGGNGTTRFELCIHRVFRNKKDKRKKIAEYVYDSEDGGKYLIEEDNPNY